MNHSILLFKFFFLFVFLIEKYSSILVFPFKTRQPIITENEQNMTKLMRSLIQNNIYITLKLGEPRQSVDTFLRYDVRGFYFSDKFKEDPNTMSGAPIYDDVNSDIKNFYDKSLSKTYNNTEVTKNDLLGGFHKGNRTIDIFEFNNTIEKMNFVLYNSTLGNMPAVIGLKIELYNDEIPYNFINQLKSKDIINSYYYTIKYTSDYEGLFIIGDQPHIYDPENYNINQLKTFYATSYGTIYQSGIDFDQILFQDINILNFHPFQNCFFAYEKNFIQGVPKLEELYDEYFKEDIEKGLCVKAKPYYPYENYKFYYCNKNEYTEKVKNFPSLYFHHNDYTFELDCKDLWIERDDKLILLVFFGDYGTNWYLGKPFLKKYQFVINPDLKTVGFYDKNINTETVKENNLLLIILISALFLILVGMIVAGVFVIKMKSDRKKKVNELTSDDGYDYIINGEGNNKE